MNVISLSEEQSNKFANMSFVCALFVVLMHVYGAPKVGSITWWMYSCTEFRLIAVPYFFLASGFFLSGKMGESKWWSTAIKKRINSLLIPYFAWSTLWEIYLFGLLICWNFICGRTILTNFNASGLSSYCGMNIFNPPHLAHLWYIRTLLIFVVISPILKFCLQKFCSLTLVIAFIFTFNFCGYKCGTWHYAVDDCLGLKVIFYFLLGIAARQGLVRMPRIGIAFPVAIATLCWLSERMFIIYGWPFANVIRAINIAVMLYVVWYFIPTRKWPTWLTSMSFPIYLVHFFWCSFFASLFYDHPETIPQIVFRFSGILIPTFITVLVLRRLPKCVNNFLFGGR